MGVTLEIPGGYRSRTPSPKIVCADGTTLSVQAGRNLYSTPRDDDAVFYSHVEVGFPSSTPPNFWEEFAEEWATPTETVYAYIPVEHVIFFIAAHGGVDMSLTKQAAQEWIADYESHVAAASVQTPDRVRYIF